MVDSLRAEGRGSDLYCSECPKNNSIAHTYLISRVALVVRASGLPLGGISGLNLDRAGSRESIASLSRLFRGIFEAVLPFFWRSEGPRDYPVRAFKCLPPRPPNLPRSKPRSLFLHATCLLIEA